MQIEKRRGLTKSYDKTITPTENSRKQSDTKTRHQNVDYTTIADRLWKFIVGVTTATRLVWLNRFTESKHSH